MIAGNGHVRRVGHQNSLEVGVSHCEAGCSVCAGSVWKRYSFVQMSLSEVPGAWRIPPGKPPRDTGRRKTGRWCPTMPALSPANRGSSRAKITGDRFRIDPVPLVQLAETPVLDREASEDLPAGVPEHSLPDLGKTRKGGR